MRRHLVVKVLLLALALVVMLAGAGTAAAAPRQAVFNIADGDVSGLIAAIADANDEGTYPGQDTINLATNGTYTLTGVTDFQDGLDALPSITSDIVINGNGSVIQRSSSAGIPKMRIFHVGAAGVLTLNDTTVRNGSVNDAFAFFTDDVFGGGIYTLGAVNLNNATLIQNTASSDGGGIYVKAGGTLNAVGSRLLANTATGTGDALYVALSAGAASFTGGCIAGNGNTALFNADAAMRIATGNWWGADDGPNPPRQW